MLDAAFLVAELAAILGGIMRAVTRSDEVSAGAGGDHAAVRAAPSGSTSATRICSVAPAIP